MRFFVLVFLSFIFLFNFNAFAGDPEDWLEDRGAISRILATWRDDCFSQTAEINKINSLTPRAYNADMDQYRQATHGIYIIIRKFKVEWDLTAYDPEKIAQLLKIPFDERARVGELLAEPLSVATRFVYQNYSDLMLTVHYTAQQYYQRYRDAERVKVGLTTDHDEMLALPDPELRKQYLNDKISMEKYMFWLPSHQRKHEEYTQKIRALEEQLAKLEHEKADGKESRSASSSAKAGHKAGPFKKTEAANGSGPSKEAGSNPPLEKGTASSVEGSKDLLSDKTEGKPEKKESKAASAVKEDATTNGDTAITIGVKKSKPRRKNGKSHPVEPNRMMQASASKAKSPDGRAVLKNHSTLQNVHNLNPHTKVQDLFKLFNELGLKMEERTNTIAVWFGPDCFKAFDRAHTLGDVVPFMDLKVAKRGLASMGINLE